MVALKEFNLFSGLWPMVDYSPMREGHFGVGVVLCSLFVLIRLSLSYMCSEIVIILLMCGIEFYLPR